MELNVQLNLNPNLEEKKRARVAEAIIKKKKATYEPTWDEIWTSGYNTNTSKKVGILQTKLTENDKRKLLEVKRAIETGELGTGVETLKKFTKTHALRMYKELLQLRRKDIILKMIKEKPKNYYLIQTMESLEWLRSLLEGEKIIALDTETTGVDVFGKDVIVGVSVTLPIADVHAYIPVRHITGELQLSPEVVFGKIKPVLENPKIKKVLHNAKFDVHMLRKEGIEVKGLHMDTMVAMGILNENEPSYALKNLATKYGKYFGFVDKSQTYEELFGKGGFENTPLDIGHIYACKDTHLTYKFYVWLDGMLKERPKLHDLYYKIEQETSLVCIEMERNGFLIDLEFAESYGRELSEQVQSLEVKLAEDFGDININSNQQLAAVLYDDMGLKDISKERKVDASTLKALAADCGAIKTLLEYREIKKLLSTYIEPLPQKVGLDKRLHGEFNQTATATGRFASKNPNLQNLPYAARGLIVAPEGKLIIGSDYSQIEPRVLSHISKDKHLQEPYLTGKDLYSTLASRVFKVPIEQCGDGTKYRKMMKTGLLAVMYGTSTFTLSQQLGISIEEAEQFIADFMETYPDVAQFIEDTHHMADTMGYVETLGGRKRRFIGHKPVAQEYHRITKRIESILGRQFKNIWQEGKVPRVLKMKYWSLAKQYGRVSRQSVNAVIQGTAADIMKIALVNLYYHCKKKGGGWRLLATIHDEVLVEIPETATPEEVQEVAEIMKGALPLSVPFKCDIEVMQRWGSGVPFKKWVDSGCGTKVFTEGGNQ